MARVTVEDCIKNVDSLFDLVLLASHRAKVLNAGNEAQVPLDNDKSTVVALREIADETRSNKLSTFLIQSSTVTLAMKGLYEMLKKIQVNN